MALIYVSLILGLIFVISFLVVRIKEGGIPGICLKSASSVCFILTSFAAMHFMKAPTYSYFIVIGQIFGLAGDIFLDLKYVHPEYEVAYTHMGFVSFGIGHIFFLEGLLLTFSFSWKNVLLAAVAAIIMSSFIYFSRKLLKLNYGKFLLDVIIYSMVIGFTMMMSLSIPVFSGKFKLTAIVFFVGILLFLLSELILSQVYFGKTDKKVPLTISNLLMYYSAQFIISCSIIFLK